MPEGKPARARRAVPSRAELDAPTLDGTLTPLRPGDDADMPVAPRARRVRVGPRGADPVATTGLILGALSVAAGCVWPLSGAAGAVAVACGLASLGGRSRPRAVAAAVLGAAGLAAGVGVAASSVALVSQQGAPPGQAVVPPPRVVPFFPE